VAVIIVIVSGGGRAPAAAGFVAVFGWHLQLQVVTWPSSSSVVVVAHLQLQGLSPLSVSTCSCRWRHGRHRHQ
jgi:hypothetical protein